ncbi:hypothetical protein CTA2_6731 [Colletotrichum tanaceti]|uniref:Uncharacterized protein n=1 Tax=Colletotrichum tanaceti TaxID=1306861 RepID=A0A4U6XKI7_9PEZI|nr:hypothetical protein CTA2_6736 [Colletotrichum tanaceti]KAJ0168383.1 hypothetical protein CTA2_6731 [Colletotrichum tanaceti]TKW55377.1 hypothetical protein CTA1_4090 [Colletotrichum tanaceti]
MSHFIHEEPVLQALFQRYRAHNLEYAVCGVLQNLVVLGFPIKEGFGNTFEQPPDGGGTRMDVLTLDLRQPHNDLVPLVLFEVKGGGSSAREAEKQALNYAQAAIRFHGLRGIYVNTFVGRDHDIFFASWVVEAMDTALRPADHGHNSYTSLWSDPEGRLWRFWQHAKTYRENPRPMPTPTLPLPTHPPSQYTFEPVQDIYDPPSDRGSEQLVDMSSFPRVEIGEQHTEGLGESQGLLHDGGQPTDPSSEYEQDNLGPQDFQPEAGSSRGMQRTRRVRYMEVDLERRKNNTGYKFPWRNRVVKTERKEWERVGDIMWLLEELNGYKVWGKRP